MLVVFLFFYHNTLLLNFLFYISLTDWLEVKIDTSVMII